MAGASPIDTFYILIQSKSILDGIAADINNCPRIAVFAEATTRRGVNI
jgi:hypothetical protein